MANRWFGSALIGLALLLPLAFAAPESKTPLHLGLPRVLTGDEPHYLVTINSLLMDGDLDLSNNYASVHAGSEQAGQRYASLRALDHHTVWPEHGVRRFWWNVYKTDAWNRDYIGNPVPRLRQDASAPPEGHPEYSTHPPGLALFLAPVLLPFRGSGYIEPLAICCSAVAVVFAMLIFGWLIELYRPDPGVIFLVTLATFLGTPIWFYARTLFTEPYLLLFTTASYGFALRRKSALISGVFIGLGILMKPTFAILLLPLFAMYLARRHFRAALLFVVPICVSLLVILSLNNAMFGSPWEASQNWQQGSLLNGAKGLLFSRKYGLLITAPIFFAVVAAWPRFFRTHTHDAIVLGSGFGLYFVLFSMYAGWAGGTCYGPRYLLPVLPLLCVSLTELPQTFVWKNKWTRSLTTALAALSIIVNGVAAMPYWRFFWDSNPLLALSAALG
jgi:hypothetical protein